MGWRRSLRRRSCSAGGGEGCVRRSATRRSRITSTSGSSWKRSARWRYSHPCSRETIYRYRTVTQFSGVRSQDISKIRRKHRECHSARARYYAGNVSAPKHSDVNPSDARRFRLRRDVLSAAQDNRFCHRYCVALGLAPRLLVFSRAGRLRARSPPRPVARPAMTVLSANLTNPDVAR